MSSIDRAQVPAAALDAEDIVEAFQAHAGELKGFLRRRLRCQETAADVTQQTYLKLLVAPPPEPVLDRRALLFRIARNIAVDYLRFRRRCATLEEGIQGLYDVTDEQLPDVNDLAIAREQLEALRRAVEDLPLRTRQVFELSRLQELPRQQVAARLNISESSVAKHLALALQFLREKVHR